MNSPYIITRTTLQQIFSPLPVPGELQYAQPIAWSTPRPMWPIFVRGLDALMQYASCRNSHEAEAAEKAGSSIRCIHFLEANHKFQVNLQRRIYGHATNVEIRPLDEEKAVQAASDFLGEFFVFSIGGGLLVFEFQRSPRSEARKEEARKQEIEGWRAEVVDLTKRLEEFEKAMKGGRGFSSWLPGISSDTKQISSSCV
ncbi:hypothetical protein R1flu_016791 [Riccia fluitans]|uniref:OPA3-like protein n=1 Tax=Riccia fluitans TaxID=41844 RepID=A0ABD1YN01_9MARC